MTLTTRALRWGKPSGQHPGGDILTAVEDARCEYLRAVAVFQSVSEPELVDWAVHLLCAAEHRYAYLTRMARSQGIHYVPELRPQVE